MDNDNTPSSKSDTPKQNENAKVESNSAQETSASNHKHQGTANLVAIDDFARIQLRVGQILEAMNLPKSEKLLLMKVDLGEEKGPRQILAGIAKHYEPFELIGRKVVVVANLKPAKLMGHISEGMLLCASDEQGHLELLSPGTLCKPGSVVR